MKIWLVALFLSGCATKVIHERKELVLWELRPRPGYIGLTSLRCLKWQGEKCLEKDVVEFDLANAEQRGRLHAARFVCRVGEGALFRVCRELPGLCRQTVVRSGFLGHKRELKLIDFLSIKEKYQYLLDKGAYCLSLDNELTNDLDF